MTRGGRGEALIEWIRGEVVSDDAVVDGPFGPRSHGLCRRHGVGEHHAAGHSAPVGLRAMLDAAPPR